MRISDASSWEYPLFEVWLFFFFSGEFNFCFFHPPELETAVFTESTTTGEELGSALLESTGSNARFFPLGLDFFCVLWGSGEVVMRCYINRRIFLDLIGSKQNSIFLRMYLLFGFGFGAFNSFSISSLAVFIMASFNKKFHRILFSMRFPNFTFMSFKSPSSIHNDFPST